MALEALEVDRRGQRGSRTMTRDRDVSEVITAVERGDSRVLDAEFLEVRFGKESNVGDLAHGSSIAAAHDAQMRDECQPHQAVGFSFHDPRVDHFDLVVSEPVDLQAHARRPARQRGVSRSLLRGAARPRAPAE